MPIAQASSTTIFPVGIFSEYHNECASIPDVHIGDRARRRFVAWLEAQPREARQARVADATGVSQSAVSKWKTSGFPQRHYAQIAALMGITESELVAESDHIAETAPVVNNGPARDVTALVTSAAETRRLASGGPMTAPVGSVQWKLEQVADEHKLEAVAAVERALEPFLPGVVKHRRVRHANES